MDVRRRIRESRPREKSGRPFSRPTDVHHPTFFVTVSGICTVLIIDASFVCTLLGLHNSMISDGRLGIPRLGHPESHRH